MVEEAVEVEAVEVEAEAVEVEARRQPRRTRPGRSRPLLATARSSSSGRHRRTTAARPSPATNTGYAAGDGVPEDTPWQSAGLSLGWTVTGLTNGQPYAFEVRALNGAGTGAAAKTVATPLGVPGMPGVPASLTATPGDGEVFLEWTAPADGGGSPVTGYEYRYAAGIGVPDATPWQDAGTELAATVTGLENETRYAFEVRARTGVGPGQASRATALPLRLRAELFSSAAAEGEALVVGVRRSGGLAFPAHAYIGVTDDALPGVTATDEGRGDGLGRHRLEFAAGAGRGDRDGHGGLRRRAPAGPGARRDARFRGTGGRRRKAAL